MFDFSLADKEDTNSVVAHQLNTMKQIYAMLISNDTNIKFILKKHKQLCSVVMDINKKQGLK